MTDPGRATLVRERHGRGRDFLAARKSCRSRLKTFIDLAIYRARGRESARRIVLAFTTASLERISNCKMAFLEQHFIDDAFHLLTALACGAGIGFERQWRQRLAGLRTNTLVSLGAAIFVVFAGQFSDESPTRVAAQVVTGIGFLGAGVISKEGANVRGLNTAATLWCSGAVGLLAGAGYWRHALLAVLLVTSINLFLRPLIAMIDRQPIESAEVETFYLVTMICRSDEEEKFRALLLHSFSTRDLHLRELDSANIEGSDRVEIAAQVTSDKQRELALELVVGRLSLETGVTAARWKRVTNLL
jgi:putative Mg2+ transporter-C (MgtC) family protein